MTPSPKRRFLVTVEYRTRSGINSKTFEAEAPSIEDACREAMRRYQGRQRVTRVDRVEARPL